MIKKCENFKASRTWCTYFRKRYSFCLHTPNTKIKLANQEDAEGKINKINQFKPELIAKHKEKPYCQSISIKPHGLWGQIKC